MTAKQTTIDSVTKLITDIAGNASATGKEPMPDALAGAFNAVLSMLDSRAHGNQRLKDTIAMVRQAIGIQPPQTEQKETLL